MEPKTFLPLVLSGFTACYASPTTATVTTFTGPALPAHHWPLDGDPPATPEPDHGPHGDEDPGDGLIVTNYVTASGNITNTSAATITTSTQTWLLPTSPSAYDRDLQFVELFKRTGASMLLRVQSEESDGQRRT